MKVKALHWVNYNGVWHKFGEVFTISEKDYAGIEKSVELLEDEADPVADGEEESVAKAEPARRGRKRKVETENE